MGPGLQKYSFFFSIQILCSIRKAANKSQTLSFPARGLMTEDQSKSGHPDSQRTASREPHTLYFV